MNPESGTDPQHGRLLLIRRLALIGVGSSFITLPLGLVGTGSVLWLPHEGSEGLAEILTLGLGVLLLILGGAGLVLGGPLAILAKRALAAPAEIKGSRRTRLMAGLVFIGSLVVIGVVLGALSPLGTALDPFHALIAAFAAGFLFVAAASRPRTEMIAAGAFAGMTFVLGVLLLGVQLLFVGREARLRKSVV